MVEISPRTPSVNPVTCGNHNIACDLSDLIETVSGVDRLEQCGDICLDDQNCKYYTYYGAESFPLQNVCFTFKSCGTVHSCDNCISEGRGCRNCLFEKVGQIKEENMINVVNDIDSESECQGLCLNNANCSIFTYFKKDDIEFPGLCFLLDRLLVPFYACDHCITGPKDCQAGFPNECQILHEDIVNIGSVMLDDSGYVHMDSFVDNGDCPIKILAVGGGGLQNSGGTSQAGGGGSGYVEYVKTLVKANTTLDIAIGSSGQDTVVASSLSSSENILVAKNGKNGGRSGNAGEGYSGGGGRMESRSGGYAYCGGSDGGDGCCHYGGHGSGVGISVFHFANHILSPGEGGKYHYGFGGGGGGVIVNDLGPDASEFQGQGYGGGGGYGKEGRGLSGLVIVEID